MLEEYLPRARILFPYLENMKGIGIKSTPKKANTLEAHGMPSL